MFRIKKPVTFLAAFAGATALLFAVAPIVQEQEGAMPMLKTEQHAHMAQDAGVWDAKCTWHGPEGSIDFVGKETISVDCGGLWTFSVFESEFMGAPFKGRGVMGYDPASKKYVGAWVDSMSTTIMRLEGGPEGESLVMMTEGKDPMTGETFPEKHVHTARGKDARTLKMVALRGGEEHVLMEIAYTRAK